MNRGWACSIGLGALVVAAGCGAGERAIVQGDAATTTTEIITVQRRDVTSERRLEAVAVPLAVEVVLSGAAGTLTREPTPGERLEPGDAVAAIDEIPVRLIPGAVPAFRRLEETTGEPAPAGADVDQLRAFLVEAGHLRGSATGAFDRRVGEALRSWRRSVGELEPASTAELGELIFLAVDPPWTVMAGGATRGELVAPGSTLATVAGTAWGWEIRTTTPPDLSTSFWSDAGEELPVHSVTRESDGATVVRLGPSASDPHPAPQTTVTERRLLHSDVITVPALAIRQDGVGSLFVWCRRDSSEEFRSCPLQVDSVVGVEAVVASTSGFGPGAEVRVQ